MAATIIAAATLRDLHRLHRQLSDLRDRQARGPRQLVAHQAQVNRAEQELAKTKDEVKNAKVACDQKQLQLKTCEAKIKDFRTKLQASASNREYQALLEQIAADEMAKSVLEDEILEALGRIEDLVAASKQAEQNVAKAKEDLAKTEQVVRQQSDVIQGDLNRVSAELQQVEAGFPVEFKEIYDRTIRSMGSDGLAVLEGDVCGGCFHQITQNMVSQLRMSHAVTCGSCGRLLYISDERMPPGKS